MISGRRSSENYETEQQLITSVFLCPSPQESTFFITMVFVIRCSDPLGTQLRASIPHLERQERTCQTCLLLVEFSHSRSKTVLFPVFPLANTRCSLRSHTELRDDAGGCSWLEKEIPRPRLCAGNAVPAAPRVRAPRRTRGKGCSCPAAGPPVRPRALPTCSGPQFAVCKTRRVAAPTSMGGEN